MTTFIHNNDNDTITFIIDVKHEGEMYYRGGGYSQHFGSVKFIILDGVAC